MAQKLLKNYLKDICKNPYTEFEAWPIDDSDLFYWEAIIFGVEGTPYQDGAFKLRIYFPRDYPYIPARITFITPIYHPNINKQGKLCFEND